MEQCQFAQEYFTRSAWKLLSEYEKRRYQNIKENYDMLKATGITPIVPHFMKVNQRKPPQICQLEKNKLEGTKSQKTSVKLFPEPRLSNRKKKTSPIDEGSLDVPIKTLGNSLKTDSPALLSLRHVTRKQFSQTVWKGINDALKYLETSIASKKPIKLIDTDSLKDSGPRYPKRNLKRKSYKEEEVSSDDEYLGCDDCGGKYKGACPVHGPMLLVCDKKVPMGVPDRATKTLPDFLSVGRSIIPKAGQGIWTESFIAKGIVFGPYEGTKHRDNEKSGYSWDLKRSGKRGSGQYVEGADKSKSNWMRFVNCATEEQRQNLHAFQFQGAVFYEVYRDVLPHTELLVCYGKKYAQFLGIDTTESNEQEPESKDVGGYACDVCDRLFTSPSALEGHRKRHPHMLPDRRHKCPHCTYSADRADHLQSHLVTHTGERAHTCTHCHKGFTRKDNLKQHLRLHTGEKPFACDTCGRRFNRLGNLHRHKRTHVGERLYRCATCGKDFTQSGSLKKHELTHTLQKPHRCPHCDYRTSRSSQLREHIARLHTRDLRHTCVLCDKRFYLPSELKKHVTKAHSTEGNN